MLAISSFTTLRLRHVLSYELYSRLSAILNLAAGIFVMKCDLMFWSMTFRDVDQFFSFLPELVSSRTNDALVKNRKRNLTE